MLKELNEKCAYQFVAIGAYYENKENSLRIYPLANGFYRLSFCDRGLTEEFVDFDNEGSEDVTHGTLEDCIEWLNNADVDTFDNY